MSAPACEWLIIGVLFISSKLFTLAAAPIITILPSKISGLMIGGCPDFIRSYESSMSIAEYVLWETYVSIGLYQLRRILGPNGVCAFIGNFSVLQLSALQKYLSVSTNLSMFLYLIYEASASDGKLESPILKIGKTLRTYVSISCGVATCPKLLTLSMYSGRNFNILCRIAGG